MRIVGIDFGIRRIGVAVSDVSATLARPHTTLHLDGKANPAAAVEAVVRAVTDLSAEGEKVGAIVVGMPAHLDGTASDQTETVSAFIAALKARVNVPVVSEDERLSSREAESRLAINERSWKKRKARVDAVAAAIVLQDYLDRHPGKHSARGEPQDV